MLRNFAEVAFDNIAWSDTSSRVTMRRVPPLLRLSVREVGVLNPLIVAKTASPDRYAIVTGWLRFQAAREVGENSVPCHIYSFPPKILLLCSLFDNIGHRHMNVIEQGLALKKLSEFYSPAEVKRTFVPVLGIRGNGETFDHLTSLSELPEDLQWAIVDGDLSSDSARALAKIPHGHRQHIVQLFRAVPMDEHCRMEAAEAFQLLLEKKETSPLEIIREEKWLGNGKATVDADARVEKDVLDLEIGLATMPKLFGGRRSGSAKTSAKGNYLQPGGRVTASGKRLPSTSANSSKRAAAHVLTSADVLDALETRLGKLKSKVRLAARLPEGARVCPAPEQPAAPHRLEVDFRDASQLSNTLRQLLDADERGALQAMLTRR